MKLSRKWLAEFTTVKADDKTYADKMTITGSKVEATEDLGATTENVVLAQVKELNRHPDADTLWVCLMDVGQAEDIIIVTGAQNLKVGDYCPAALHKSKLPCGKEIKKGKLRGVESNGMLVSLDELCLEQNDYPYAVEDGILTFLPEEMEGFQVGDDIRPLLGFDDKVVEFEITSNRPDCLSAIGIARETAASFDTELRLAEPTVKGSAGNISEHLDAEILDEDLCKRLSLRLVKNVKIKASPLWMRQRLRAHGVRPINNIVDITNYVMLEYGQPMHAFDYDSLAGGTIYARRSKAGESIETLDGVVRNLEDALVIADAEKAVGIAGVMGGASSEITEKTTTVVFEAANFDATSIRKTASKLGLRTDASGRFEKGLDPMTTIPAINRAAELVEQLGAGEVVDGYLDLIAYDSTAKTLQLEYKRINALLGTEISRDEMVKILEKVGFTVTEDDMVTVPSWRLDVTVYADLAEEVARFYGYDIIPSTMFAAETTQGGFSKRQKQERAAGALFRSLGFHEILTYTFTGQYAYDNIRLPEDSILRENLRILNPLGEDTSHMRRTAIPAMLDILARNANYRNPKAKLYELAKIYIPKQDSETLCDEVLQLTLGTYGAGQDFYCLKGAVEQFLSHLRITGETWVSCTDDSVFHPGRTAEIFLGEQSLGRLGQVHPLTAKNYGFETEVFVANLNLEVLFANMGAEKTYVPLPKFPSMTRDIALVCEENITAAAVKEVILQAGGKRLISCDLFDVYTGEHIEKGKKSMAFALSFRAEDKTLTDEETDAQTSKILNALKEKLNAVLRA